MAVNVEVATEGHLIVANSEANTASSLVRMYFTSLGKLEYHPGIIPDFSAFISELANTGLFTSSSSQVVGMAVSRTDLTQLG